MEFLSLDRGDIIFIYLCKQYREREREKEGRKWHCEPKSLVCKKEYMKCPRLHYNMTG